MKRKLTYLRNKVLNHLFSETTIALYIQKLIAVSIFILGLSIFISSAMPTSADVEIMDRISTSQNYPSSSFLTYLFPITPHDVQVSMSGSASSSAQVIHDDEQPPKEVPPSHNGYCLQVPILLYHHIQPLSIAKKVHQESLTVDPSFFEQHLIYLQSQGFTPITISQLEQALLTQTPLPEKSIAITIDDGYEDNYVYAYQLLQQYGMRGNFMIPTALLETNGYMTWTQVQEISSSGHGIYNHTTTHAPLGYITKEKIIEEVTTAQTKLETMLNQENLILTYPYGSYNDLAIQTLKELGFRLALTTVHGRTQCDTSIMTLYREHVGNAPLSYYGL